jgi:predicted kinase
MSKIVPTKPLLVLLYGFPGAGKTFVARNLSDAIGAAHVQGDRIRTELFEQPRYDQKENTIVSNLMDYMTEEFLSAGVSVVYDVNAARVAKRRVMRDLARRSHVNSLLIWIQIDAESSFDRAIKRDRRHSDDKYSMNLDRTTFDALTGQMQNPGRDEDYIVISGKHTFNTQLSAVTKKLHELGLITSNEVTANVVKPGLVNLIPKSPNTIGGRVDLTRRNITIR